MSPIIKYSELHYASFAANTVNLSTGICPQNDEEICVYRFRANGADPSAYVALIWDLYGDDEKTFVSTKGDVDVTFQSEVENYHVIGDGVKKLQIVVINDNDTATPIIGGAVEVLGVL